MTAQERSSANPKMLIKDSRKRRIAKGSGTRVQDVNRLIKQFTEMQKMMKQAKKAQKSKRRGFMPRLPFKSISRPIVEIRYSDKEVIFND